MADTDWREILSFSQKDLKQADKDKLCESLSWMEADDIELNFTDLKTLFRLAQDILKYKSEQVNNLLGQVETLQRKSYKSKSKTFVVDSPAKSSDTVLETIAHQEEVIKANKEILEQLYIDIAELEGRKNKVEEENENIDRESESSRDALSEMNAMAQLENEFTVKNKHIRKLLVDLKMLEDENTKFKEKITLLKDKLTEATKLIENFTEQLLALNNENSNLKDILGKSEESKINYSLEIESLRRKLFENDNSKESAYEEVKSKVQHWKNLARAKKNEIEKLANENTKLKERLIRTIPASPVSSPKKNAAEELKIKELQEKLSEASNEIIKSAELIDLLTAQNKQLKSSIEDIPDSVSEIKNESDDGKERVLINKLKKKNKLLTTSLQEAEEMTSIREKELTEITAQLQLIQSEEGIKALLDGIKSKKKQLKFKEEGIKSLVQEINSLHQMIDDLQLENETLRQKFNIPSDEKIYTRGILKKYHDIEKQYSELSTESKDTENKLVHVELQNRDLKLKISKLIKALNKLGYNKNTIMDICDSSDNENDILNEDAKNVNNTVVGEDKEKSVDQTEMRAIIEENEGLRKGLEDILNFLKDNSTTSSGILMLQCPSLEALLRAMEARHSAGWFAPHMSTVLELRAAIGGKDALLTALHEARKETFDVMAQLRKESLKTLQLEQKINEIELMNRPVDNQEQNISESSNVFEFGPWMANNEINNIDLLDKSEIEKVITESNAIYENHLKKSLSYFHGRFKELFDKMTSTMVHAADEANKWAIQEEQYKAQIENLKDQLHSQEDEDISDDSPGVIQIPSATLLQRKCIFLEDSYKNIRTINENMKNEILHNKKEIMVTVAQYENRLQKLILSVADLTDKLRLSIPIDLFWKQNKLLNESLSKYRKLVNDTTNKNTESQNLSMLLENSKLDILNTFRKEIENFQQYKSENNTDRVSKLMTTIEATTIQKQLQEMCSEIENKNKQIENLEAQNTQLQESQARIVDESLASATKQEIDLLNGNLNKITDHNKLLKEQCQHVESQLEIALLQLQDSQQRQMTNDMEINMLRHQILDLQSISDNKAILAKLSGEVLVAHLQSSENFKKIERLNTALKYEKQLRIEAEDMLNARQKIFDVYSFRYESKFRYMYEVMQNMRQQYQGSIPIASVENYLNKIEDFSRKSRAADEKLFDIEDLQSRLMIKHAVFDQVLDVMKNNCINDEENCPHKLKLMVENVLHCRELEHLNQKLKLLELSREELASHCNSLEKTLVLVNQGFEKSVFKNSIIKKSSSDSGSNINFEMEDIHSDDDGNAKEQFGMLSGSRTFSLKQPKVLKPPKVTGDTSSIRKNDNEKPEKSVTKISVTNVNKPEVLNTSTQTSFSESKTQCNYRINSTQTEEDQMILELSKLTSNLKMELDKRRKDLEETQMLAEKRADDILKLNSYKYNLDTTIQNLRELISQKDSQNNKLQATIEHFKQQLDDYKNMAVTEKNKSNDQANDETKSLLLLLKQLETDKNAIVTEYKELLKKEREDYSKSVKDFNIKLMDLQSQLDRKGIESNTLNAEGHKEALTKYTLKIKGLEDKCFKLQSELDGRKTEINTYQSEVDRWKDLATERLVKMEHLNSQIQQRHCHEVESYKAENQHWLTQLNETQREHMALRTRITEQKTLHIKQLADKDTQIDHLRSIIQNLKTQVVNMQTLISINDPNIDLSAILEVEESNDAISQNGSNRLELKFDSTIDLRDMQEDIARIPATSSAVWQEPIIERLRQEKNMTSKQNLILRRQIKALAARERRSRLDAQNLKSQVYRISTSGSKTTSAEATILQNKISALQSQLTSARRDTQSSVALWDKWKRAQQSAERWQGRYEEKFQEVKKLETSLNLAKAAVTRLEKEKRLLLTRLSEVKNETILLAIEKQESEHLEKSMQPSHECNCSSPPPVSSQALLERVQAQQRRIVALEVAEKGNEVLVSEYEKALAEITSLKGQVLKLESTLLESQIRSPLKSTSHDSQPELDYWKSYCEMLKEENVQLTMRVNSLETTPSTTNHQRVNDLEQTVLTLRGLVSKLQSEQKSMTVTKRVDSRPGSGRSGVSDRSRAPSESLRIETANLKRSIMDKDLLLEKSKEMLKIAAEREDELLRENTQLRRRINELTSTRPKEGFLSA